VPTIYIGDANTAARLPSAPMTAPADAPTQRLTLAPRPSAANTSPAAPSAPADALLPLPDGWPVQPAEPLIFHQLTAQSRRHDAPSGPGWFNPHGED
jgi:hypothetical protein